MGRFVGSGDVLTVFLSVRKRRLQRRSVSETFSRPRKPRIWYSTIMRLIRGNSSKGEGQTVKRVIEHPSQKMTAMVRQHEGASRLRGMVR